MPVEVCPLSGFSPAKLLSSRLLASPNRRLACKRNVLK